MRKPNQLYEIFIIENFDIGLRDHEEIETEVEKIGEQWAVSERQAVSRFCYKTNCRSVEFHEWEGDTGRTTRIIARLKP
jgi:hypothetical protein